MNIIDRVKIDLEGRDLTNKFSEFQILKNFSTFSKVNNELYLILKREKRLANTL